MPQASDEDRDQAEKYFGDPVSDEGPMKFLHEQGFVLGRDWAYRKPGARWQDLSEKEKFSISFLCDEWDFGGFEDDEKPPMPISKIIEGRPR
jgi:hypothetical protein